MEILNLGIIKDKLKFQQLKILFLEIIDFLEKND